MSIVFKRGHWKTFTEATDAVSSVINAPTDFTYPDFDVIIFEAEILEANTARDLGGWKSKDDYGSSALQGIHEICQTYCLSVQCDIRSV